MTGASGLLGYFWINYIQDLYEVFLVSHDMEIKNDNHKTVKLNLFDLGQIINFISKFNIDIVVNLAGIANVDKCEVNPKLAFKVNQLIPKLLAKACNLTDTELIHISTDHLFGNEIIMHEEQNDVILINQYAKSKYAGECDVIREYPKALIIRTNFFGKGPKHRSSFSDWIINSLINNQYITLFDDVFFNPILGSKVAEYAHKLLELGVSGIYNLSSDDSITKYEFGKYLVENLNFPKKFIKRGYFKDRNDLTLRPLCLNLSNKKASNSLGHSLGKVQEHINLLIQKK